jgi:hypothetical protein
MKDRAWGHCQDCRFFAKPEPVRRLDGHAGAYCQHPVLSKYQLFVYGAGGCNGFDLRPSFEDRPAW